MGSIASIITGNDERHDEYEPNEENVYEVRRILLRWVPVELAVMITDDAEYWPKTSFAAQVDIHSFFVSRERGPTSCLLTPKLCDMIQVEGTFKVRKVKFKIKSHDQGWGGEPDLPGKYMGSYTWFEAAIIREARPTTQDDAKITAFIREFIRVRRTNDAPLEKEDEETVTFGNEYGEFTFVKNPNDTKTDVWHIQRNVRASIEEKVHEIVWTEYKPSEDLDEKESRDMTGRGLGVGFVRSLRPTDRIVVIGRAEFAGWVNHVKAVELEVCYSV